MQSMKLLLVFSFQILAVLGLRANPLINLPRIKNEYIKWPEDKINTLTNLLETLSVVGNVTLIGWQQIFSETGTLKEIRTIELTLFGEAFIQGDTSLAEYAEEEVDDLSDLVETSLKSTGVSVSGCLQQWDRDGDLATVVYADKDVLLQVFPDSDYLTYERNITLDTTGPVQVPFSNKEREDFPPVSRLEWNAEGGFIEKDSKIIPELLASVTDAENATAEMVDVALKGISRAALMDPEEVTISLARSMRDNFPDYKWQIFQGNPTVYLARDVYINAEYDATHNMNPFQMAIYGLEKSS